MTNMTDHIICPTCKTSIRSRHGRVWYHSKDTRVAFKQTLDFHCDECGSRYKRHTKFDKIGMIIKDILRRQHND